MAIVATDDFSGTLDTTINGKATTTGGKTWTSTGNFGAEVTSQRLDGAGKCYAFANNGLSFVSVGSADCYSTADITVTPASSSAFGLTVACVDWNNFIGLTLWDGTQLVLKKRVAGTYTNVAIFSVGSIAINDIFRLEREGTTVKVFKNGTQVGAGAGYAVADSVFTGVSNVGIWSPFSNATSAFGSFEGGTLGALNTVGIDNGPVTHKIYQRNAGSTSKALTFSGTFSGTTPSDIQAQIETDGGTVISAWATLTGSTIGAGSYTTSTVSVPQSADWLILKLRTRDSGGAVLATTQTSAFGVGIIVLIDGQSNGVGLGNVAGAPTLTVKSSYWNGTTWADVVQGGGGSLVQQLGSAAGCVVAIANTSASGSGIALHSPPSGTYWLDTVDRIAQMGGDIEAVAWVQGESDSNTSSDVSASYAASLSNIVDSLLTITARSASQFGFFIAATGRTTGTGNEVGWSSVRKGQADAAVAHASIYISHDCIDLSMVDSLHYDTAGQVENGLRFGRSIAKWLGAYPYDARGPRIVGASILGSAVTVTFDLNGASGLVGTGALTGWEYFNGSVWATVTDAAVSGNAVIFSASGATKIRYLYGQTIDVSNLARGNVKSSISAVGYLPVEPTRVQMDLSVAVDKTASVNLVNASNTPQASLTGLKWAWFDQITPDLMSAPTDKGIAETTDGSGVLTVIINNSSKVSGQVGWLIVTDSDGTTAMTHKAFAGPVAVS